MTMFIIIDKILIVVLICRTRIRCST